MPCYCGMGRRMLTLTQPTQPHSFCASCRAPQATRPFRRVQPVKQGALGLTGAEPPARQLLHVQGAKAWRRAVPVFAAAHRRLVQHPLRIPSRWGLCPRGRSCWYPEPWPRPSGSSRSCAPQSSPREPAAMADEGCSQPEPVQLKTRASFAAPKLVTRPWHQPLPAWCALR